MENLVRTAATQAADWIVVLPLVLALLGAALALIMRNNGRVTFFLALLVVGAMLACEIGLIARIWENGPVSMTMGNWLPPFGISFAADLFGALFALTAAFAGLVVIIYAETERTAAEGRDGFHALVLLLLAGVTGSFLTGDLFNLYVWFEVVLIASFGLIVSRSSALQLDGAVKYGFLNFLATALFLLALGLVYGLLGTLNMADIIGKAWGAHPAAMTAVGALLLLAFGMKAAAFPVNAWLPASYHAPPAAVSALFAGLLTKVGVYAILRSLVVLLPGSRDVLEPAIAVAAIGSLILGPLGAIAETNLRRAMGFLLIGGIGAALVGIALATPSGIGGTGAYIFHSMLTMTGLYLVAGLIERATGETDTRRMGGLYAQSPALSIMFLVLIFALAGVPPLLGFWPKLLLIEASLQFGDGLGIALMLALVFNAVLTLIAGTRLWAHVFWRDREEGLRPEKAGSRRLRYGAPAILVGVIIFLGIWPNLLIAAAKIGASDVIDPARYIAAVGLAGGAP
ncbi:proton-conducting transporter membrane subunit [Devosia submarina]|uniref:proton-conducting transporter transmembrane domain-containing protein n=1 Tax=Devosia submarina TaxID=1173082 RepID=UPI000D379EA7|nr:proton-conducting transporter membrane subunit [Devosia submarina]